MTETDDQAWLENLEATNGYSNCKLTGDGRYVGLSEFIFTIGIIEGTVGDEYVYNRRWCYHPPLALHALLEWEARGFEGDPIGWKRAV